MSAPQTFGARLRDARDRCGFSVHSQADKAKVSEAVYRGWERDEGSPTRMQVKRMFGGAHPIMHYVPASAPPSAPDLSSDLVRASGVPAGLVTAVLDAELDMPAAAPVLDPQPSPPSPPQLPPGGEHARRLAVAACATLGDAIRDCRVAVDLPQREIGELLGVRQGTVSQWETGEQLPIADHYDRLCDLFPELHAYELTEQVRDIVKPPGNRTANQCGGRPAGAPDSAPRGAPVTSDVAAPASAPAPEDAPRAPDGLEMLASAIALANVLWPEDVPHRALTELLPGGGGWCLTVEGGDSPSLRGEGRTARLALGRLRTALRGHIDERSAELNRELEEQRRRIEARQAQLAELRAMVDDGDGSDER